MVAITLIISLAALGISLIAIWWTNDCQEDTDEHNEMLYKHLKDHK